MSKTRLTRCGSQHVPLPIHCTGDAPTHRMLLITTTVVCGAADLASKCRMGNMLLIARNKRTTTAIP